MTFSLMAVIEPVDLRHRVRRQLDMPAWQPIPRRDDEIADVPVGIVSQEILDIGHDRRECHAGVARRIRLSARSLLQAAQNGGAGLRYAGIDRLAPWHDRPAAFLDVRRLFI